jgi:hypothetical protein
LRAGAAQQATAVTATQPVTIVYKELKVQVMVQVILIIFDLSASLISTPLPFHRHKMESASMT